MTRCQMIFRSSYIPDDLDRIEEIVADAMERVPLAGAAGLERIINGPIPYAPDGLPLIGPMPGVKNAFEACVFTFGIAQGGGAGQGPGRVDHRRRDRVGHVVLRSAPVHRLHGSGILQCEGHGGLWQ